MLHRKIRSSWFIWTSERGYKSSATVSLLYPSTHILCSLHPVNRIINSKLKKYFFKQSLRVPGKLGPCCWSFSLTSCTQIRHTTEQHIYKGYLSTIEGRVIFSLYIWFFYYSVEFTTSLCLLLQIGGRGKGVTLAHILWFTTG